MKQLFVISSLFLIVVLFGRATALKCWRCSSDSQYGALCTDNFNETLFTEDQRRTNLIECPKSTNPTSGTACQKMKIYVYDKLVITRSCATGPPGQIDNVDDISFIKIDIWEVCDDRDGCNGSGQYRPIAVFVALTVLFAKFLTLQM